MVFDLYHDHSVAGRAITLVGGSSCSGEDATSADSDERGEEVNSWKLS